MGVDNPAARFRTQLSQRLRRLAVRAGLGGGPSSFTRVSYLIPRQVVLITGRHQQSEALWPVDWHMPVSLEPPMYAFSCEASGHGARVVRNSGAFVVNFVGAEHESAILAAGATSGDGREKRVALGLNAEECAFVDAPRLSIAQGWLECAVLDQQTWGSRVLVVGQVRHANSPGPVASLFHERPQ